MTQERMSADQFRKRQGLPPSGQGVTVPVKVGKPCIRMPKPVKMTKTEMGYRDILLNEFKSEEGYEVLFEPWSFKLKSGVRYSPDFVVMHGSQVALCVETKGGYKLHSTGRSHMAFKTAVSEWPHLYWRYASKSKDGWNVTQIP